MQSSFKPAWWLRNKQAQTIFPSFSRRDSIEYDAVERLELPDGDFLDLVWVTHGVAENAPLVIFLHGLGGSIESSYVAGQLKAYNRNGWRGLFMHFRGASSEPNRLSRAYHSGDTADLQYLLKTLHEREPQTKKAAVGISMGGNILLKWLGEYRSQTFIQAAVAVSVPFQLNLIADQMNRGFARFYQRYLMRKLKKVFHRKLSSHGEALPFSAAELDALRCFWTFDDRITAPLHGFSHVHAYYKEASCRQYLSNIATPTLIIHAKDDPFMSKAAIPTNDELSVDVTLELSEKGGHVGFVSGRVPGKPIYWLDERIPGFLKDFLNL